MVGDVRIAPNGRLMSVSHADALVCFSASGLNLGDIELTHPLDEDLRVLAASRVSVQ